MLQLTKVTQTLPKGTAIRGRGKRLNATIQVEDNDDDDSEPEPPKVVCLDLWRNTPTFTDDSTEHFQGDHHPWEQSNKTRY